MVNDGEGSSRRHQAPTSSSPGPSTPSSHKRRKRADYIEPPESSGSPKRQRVLSSATRVFILADKLTSEEHDALRKLVVDLGGLNASMSFANVIITSLRAPARVARYIDKEVLSRNVPVVHTSWLYDSAREQLLQSYDSYKIMGGEDTQASLEGDHQPAEKRPESVGTRSSELQPTSPDSAGSRTESEPDEETVNDEPGSQHVESHEAGDATAAPVWRNVEYACMRPSPLRSKDNQDLVDELEVLRLQRILAGKQEMNATAYGRAISAIKAYPHALKPNPANAKNLKGVGPKIAKMIVQYYEEGRIAEAEAIRTDAAFGTMNRFMELYGVGPKRAREYYSEGARSLDDVIKMGGSLGVHLHIDECLRILPDLQRKIPRGEVQEISRIIFEEVEQILFGCSYTICGGYRRGKQESNDVDIVISLPKPSDEALAKGRNGLWEKEGQLTLMEDLLRSLKRKAFVTHVVNVSHPSSIYEQTFSRLDLAEVVVLPSTSKQIPVARYRRVDIILGPWETHGAAVLGWTGSRQFERDLRLVAKHKGFTFHSTGLVYQGERKPLRTPSEKDVFHLLDLPFMPPTMRNCDA